MFAKIKKFYEMGLYSREQVAEFWKKGKITEDEYRQIVGD